VSQTRATVLCICTLLFTTGNVSRAAADAAKAGTVEAASDTGPRLVWNESWPRFRPVGYALTGASLIAAVSVTFLIDYPDHPRANGGILFDDAVRDSLRARDPGARDAVRAASNITLGVTLAQTALLDSLILPLADGSPDIAAQLTLMNAQAFSLNILITTLLSKAVARARPTAADCKRDPTFDPLCKSSTYASFPSFHTSTAFTAAGLTCVHHAYLPIYGSKPWDTAACAESIVVAAATGVFRIVGDRHYATDVLLGAAIGFSLGYVYPWLLHYRFDAESRASRSASWAVLPTVPYGLSLAGAF
jgi:membrane-associated phospholipid phosphatase